MFINHPRSRAYPVRGRAAMAAVCLSAGLVIGGVAAAWAAGDTPPTFSASKLLAGFTLQTSYYAVAEEVRNDGFTFVEKDVSWLNVAVYHALGMSIPQRIGYALGDCDGFFDWELAVPDQLLPQRLALDVGHDVVQEAVGFTGVDQCQDVGMIELGRDLDFVEEPLGPNDRCQFRPEHLYRDLTVVLQVLGEVNRRHAPSAD